MGRLPFNEAALIGEISEILGDEGYPWTAGASDVRKVRQRMEVLEDEKRAAYGQLFRLAEDLQAVLQLRDKDLVALRRSRQEAFFRLALMAETKNGGSPQHVLRIGVLSALLAHWLGFDAAFCDRMELAAPLLDVGEVDIPEAVLRQQGPLSEQDKGVIQGHPRTGFQLLAGSGVEELDLAAEIALAHHEWFDGSGYPYGLVGAHIPAAARIVAVADCLEALCLARPWRGPWSLEDAMNHLAGEAGSHFDPAVIAALLRGREAVRALREDMRDEQEAPDFFARWRQSPWGTGYWRHFMAGRGGSPGPEAPATAGVSEPGYGWPDGPGRNP